MMKPPLEYENILWYKKKKKKIEWQKSTSTTGNYSP